MKIKEACPFCKLFSPYVDIIYSPGSPKKYRVVCSGCDAQGPKANTESLAVEFWDKRASLWQLMDNLDPRKHKNALAVCSDGDMYVIMHTHFGWTYDEYSSVDLSLFTHWMPLPELPGIQEVE